MQSAGRYRIFDDFFIKSAGGAYPVHRQRTPVFFCQFPEFVGNSQPRIYMTARAAAGENNTGYLRFLFHFIPKPVRTITVVILYDIF
jgi:hypothetical protein